MAELWWREGSCLYSETCYYGNHNSHSDGRYLIKAIIHNRVTFAEAFNGVNKTSHNGGELETVLIVLHCRVWYSACIVSYQSHCLLSYVFDVLWGVRMSFQLISFVKKYITYLWGSMFNVILGRRTMLFVKMCCSFCASLVWHYLFWEIYL